MGTCSAEAWRVGECRGRAQLGRFRAGGAVEGGEIKATRSVEKGSSFPDLGGAEAIPGTCYQLLLNNPAKLQTNESNYALGKTLFCCMAAVSGASAITTAKPLNLRVSE